MKNIREYEKNQRLQKKKEIFELFGNKCSNPYNIDHTSFETNENFLNILQIDHVNGGGVKELRKMNFSRGIAYYNMVLKKIKSGSKDYQLLCPNCNWLKRIKNKER